MDARQQRGLEIAARARGHKQVRKLAVFHHRWRGRLRDVTAQGPRRLRCGALGLGSSSQSRLPSFLLGHWQEPSSRVPRASTHLSAAYLIRTPVGGT